MGLPKPVVLAPGVDPTLIEWHPPERHLSRWLMRLGIVGVVIIGGLWFLFNSRTPGKKVVIELTDTPSPFITSTPGDFTRTPTPSALPTDTPQPTATKRPTTTGTPTATIIGDGCRTDTCVLIVGNPAYNPTKAMAMYQTQVAPLTPSRTPTITRTPTRTNTPKPARNPVSRGGGGGSSARAPDTGGPIAAMIRPTAFATYWLPPVAATVAPTEAPPLPLSCVPGYAWVNWGDPASTPYVVTTTPQPECIPGAPTSQYTPTPTMDYRTPITAPLLPYIPTMVVQPTMNYSGGTAAPLVPSNP